MPFRFEGTKGESKTQNSQACSQKVGNSGLESGDTSVPK